MNRPVESELYEILEISVTATQEEIKKSFRKQALQHHPDKGGDEARYKKIQEAYEILSNDEKRKLYDRHGKNGVQEQPDNMHPFFRNGINLFNMFRNMNNNPFSGSHSSSITPIEHRLNVSLEELCMRKAIKLNILRKRLCGCAKTKECGQCESRGFVVVEMEMSFGRLQAQKPCDRCGGKGRLLVSCGDCQEGLKDEEKVFTVNLFPEMNNGYKITFSGEGNQGVDKSPGDIIITIAFQPHAQFKLSENDLICEQKITLKEALCGHDFFILHPSGRNLRIIGNEILHKNITKRIRGEGLHSGGDLHINFDIIFPESLTEEQRKNIVMIL